MSTTGLVAARLRRDCIGIELWQIRGRGLTEPINLMGI
jgi:hypothetical protein